MRDYGYYRNIYRKYNGYVIQHNNEHFGFYTDLAEALFDRDRFEEVDWDMEMFVHLPETDNPYKSIELPAFEHDALYITIIPQRYKVQKRINGKVVYFGTYLTLDDARKRRDELIQKQWVD